MSLGCNALALATVVGATVMLSASPQPPLRVCADPNNMPFSNTKQQGFENRIASILAAQMQRPLIYLWRPERRGLIRTALTAGCATWSWAPQ